ncbi:MAG: GNAT family N-acetyltransferase [Beijerinckiaceae bacterium]
MLSRALRKEELPVVHAVRVTLRAPRIADFDGWSQLRRDSRAFLEPWEPVWPADDLTKAAFRRRVRLAEVEMRAGTAYRFLIFRNEDDRLVGGITLSQVRRGSALTGTVGYWVGAAHARQGYMTAAVKAVQWYAFGPLSLHRLEAACLPSNTASIALLEKSGFQREGYARDYLQIAGRWHDHLLYAVLARDLSAA